MQRNILLLFFFLIGLTANAHVISHTEYLLSDAQNGTWNLKVKLQTIAIHQALVAQYPDLQGYDLNSDEFKRYAYDYLVAAINIGEEDRQAVLLGQEINFGGRFTEAIFVVENLPVALKEMAINITSFIEADDQIINEVRIEKEGQRYQFQLTEKQTEIGFSFEDNRFFKLNKTFLGMSSIGLIGGVSLAGAFLSMFLLFVAKNLETVFF